MGKREAESERYTNRRRDCGTVCSLTLSGGGVGSSAKTRYLDMIYLDLVMGGIVSE